MRKMGAAFLSADQLDSRLRKGETKMRNVVCLLEIDSNGEEMWEMVYPKAGACIEYFSSKDTAVEYATANNINITEWIED